MLKFGKRERARKIGRGKIATHLAENGFSVVPMHSLSEGVCTCHRGRKCKSPGKHPWTAHGVKDSAIDQEIIKRWWVDQPTANVGIATGRRSNVIVIDIDPRNGGEKTFASLQTELGALPETVTSLTGGGGRHLIFAYPNDVKIKKDSAGKLLGPGIDILSDGAIMIAPPSRHASGKRYAWKSGCSPQDIRPARLPDAWLEKLGSNESRPDAIRPNEEPFKIPQGQRNQVLTSKAGILREGGLAPSAILAALKEQNRSMCEPPLSDEEVEGIANSITRYPAGVGSIRQDEAEKLMSWTIDNHFNQGKHLIYGADAQFWNYNGKHWAPVRDRWVEGCILKSIQSYPGRASGQTSSLIAQVKSLLQASLSTVSDPLGFTAGEPPSVINCANGEVWISSEGKIQLKRHRPESYLRHCLNIEYDPEAKCPEYDNAVLEIFGAANDPKAMRRHWNELFGYIIQPRRNIPLIVIMLGGGSNGKTVLARTIIKLIGQSLVQSQRIEELERNQFALGALLGKLLYLDDDVRAGARLPDGILKTISEAKEVTGQAKYKPDFNFVVRTVPMLLCNNVPSLADVSYGMLRRLMVVPFNRSFKENKDESLFERIWQNEMSGVLNRALRGYARLLERGHFKYPVSIRQATDEWLKQANPLPAFIEARCIRGVEQKCWLQDIYKAYQEWAKDAGFTMVQNRLSFQRNLENLSYKTDKGNRGRRVRGLTLL